MRQAAKVGKENALKAYGSIWLVEDMGGRIYEHLGKVPPALHFGGVYQSQEEAQAACGVGYEVHPLPETILLPDMTPVPSKTAKPNITSVRSVYILSFDDLMASGLRIEAFPVNAVEFDTPQPHLVGRVDFTATAFLAGERAHYRVLVEYDADMNINIVDNPMVLSDRSSYAKSEQKMAFFNEDQAARAADEFEADLRKAGDWRSRSPLPAIAA